MYTTVSDVQAAARAGVALDFVFFWGHTPGNGAGVHKSVMSQWYPAGFTVAGIHYPTTEHWMMAGKARLFGDDAMLAQILATEDPARAKKLGRKVRGFRHDVWVARRSAIVTEGNLHKFSQDADRKAFLLSTGDRVLVEASPVDRIWGIGWAENDPQAADPLAWRGENLLGFAIMAVRDQLRRSG